MTILLHGGKVRVGTIGHREGKIVSQCLRSIMKVTDVILVDISHCEHRNWGPAIAAIDFNIPM